MRAIDRLLRRWRTGMAAPYVRAGDRLLDVGCHDGEFLARVGDRVSRAVGIDPLAEPSHGPRMTILRGTLPGDTRLTPGTFDCVTMLATLEHVDDPAGTIAECARLLAPGGRLVMTVPHPAAHRVIEMLARVGLADGMGLDLAHGLGLGTVEPMLVRAGLDPVVVRPFELGLNRLYVFEKRR